MLHQLKEFVKTHRFVYKIYYVVWSALVNFLKIFVRPDDKLVLLVSYGGRHYSDSPRIIYERMVQDPRFSDFHYVWGFVNPSQFDVPNASKTRIDSLNYFIVALKARVWITNVVIERALNFKGKNTFYLCTSHGMPLKGIRNDGDAFDAGYPCLYDCILAQSEFDIELQKANFKIDSSRIALLGYPRNDKFFGDLSDINIKVRDYFDIPSDKRIVLYAPTYRDWNRKKEVVPIDINKWESKLGDKYVLLYRAHPTVVFEQDDYLGSFFKNASSYESLDDLLIAADILISDYSSMFFDYSIMHKPMICWAYDYDTFKQYRDLKVDVINEVYGGIITEEEIIDYIEKGDYSESIDKAVAFQKKYVTVYGNATSNALDLIYDKVCADSPKVEASNRCNNQ